MQGLFGSLLTIIHCQAGIVECDECGRKVLDLKRHKEILHKYVLALLLKGNDFNS